jgi:glycine/D-amino acid oxidase-like deaminating enzyme
MPFNRSEYDVVIIGGGFYGCCLAIALAKRARNIVLIERESDLLLRASYANQARVHNGYHYPRSILTAGRSAANYPRFLKEFEVCVDRSFIKVYAIARGTSKVTAYQFAKFCNRVGIPIRPAPRQIKSLFNDALIEEVFVTEECAFDAVRLRESLKPKLAEAGVEVVCGEEVERVLQGSSRDLRLVLASGVTLDAHSAFNCTYARINQLLSRSNLPKLPLKHEMTELALMQMPPQLEKMGVTVMDGPFFSTMPFPALGLHTLSHVTYTPHFSWNDLERDPPPPVRENPKSRHIFMLKDAQRYLPALHDARYVSSHFELKTVLLQNEVDDGRPILCRQDYGIKGLNVVLGAKIDNIYDIIQSLEAKNLIPEAVYGSSC